ncbi:membrane cofactor protein-like isoform X3 [Mesoplodon densirostris]|uniref:membrane cofactor protein-like isoform X3 n=1 Tax=Mesoplodon densirostris TaxID=48708 RepID=UPI0028DCE12A|nr:membrane cofactor protein-like isoform X3 [Mesoplodon densirostris]
MTASFSSRKAPPYRSESPFSSRCFVGILLVALLLLLPISSDACGEPPRFETMQLRDVPKPSYSPGESIHYECRPGYQPKRPPLPTSAVCQDDNMWSVLQEACTRKQCPNLGDPANGQIKYPNGSILFGSQAHYVCNDGYFLIGPSILYCDISESTVSWSDNPPICEKILCKPPEKILNGKYTNNHKDIFEYSEVVTYSCDASNGTDPYSLVGESKLVCIGKDKWSSDPPQCKVVKCVYPYVENGMIVSGRGPKFYYKAMVVYRCNEGFKLNGSNKIVCSANSTWEPEIPTCIKESTTPSTQPPISSASVSTPPSSQPPVPSVSESTTPSTQPPISSASVSTPPSSQPPVPSVSGYPSPSDETPPKDAESLGAGIIVAIVIGALFGVGVVVCSICFCFGKKKKGKEGIATYSAYQDKATTPAE